MEEGVVIERLEAFVYRYPIASPVATSFGVMRDRPAVFVRVEAADGAFGWGEIFANWPAAGAEHRARLLMMDVADLALGARLHEPGELFESLERKTRIRAIQCGEQGPFRQVIAGLDIALWDLFARRRGLPLKNLLSPAAPEQTPAYASGVEIGRAAAAIPAARRDGHTHFKVKVGFDVADDAAAIRALFASLNDGEALYADANQAWGLDEASAFLRSLRGAPLGWLEEPMPVDAPPADWERLAAVSDVPLAGGENIAGAAAFAEAVADGFLSVMQPDVAKWGGVTGCLAVAKAALAAGRTYCPHFLGGGLGLIASAHLLAAVGGPGRLEVDVNPNPLRDALVDASAAVEGGMWSIGEGPGLGVEALPDEIDKFQTLKMTRDRRGAS